MQVSILQWNVWYDENIEHVANFVKETGADILCLQELTFDSPNHTISDTPAYIAGELGYEYYYKEIPIDDTDGEKLRWANGVFSRFPITKNNSVWINQPKANGGYDDEYRAYVEATVKIGDKDLSVGTTHMSYTHKFEGTPNKKLETDALLKTVKTKTKNFVFTGDLNATPDTYTIKELEKILTHAGPDFSEKSWTTKPFSYNGFEATELLWRLDYVFATPDVKVTSAKILKTTYSDHLPILVTIEI